MSSSSLISLTADLVRIDSVNPDLVPDGAGEEEIARFVAGWLEGAGLEVETEEVAPGRFNVVGIARGSGEGRSLLLNAHLDTVGVAGMDAPFEPRTEDGRLYGRGAYDMKASLAAIMLAGAQAVDAGLRGDVIVTAVCDEEVGSIGSEESGVRPVRDADHLRVARVPTHEGDDLLVLFHLEGLAEEGDASSSLEVRQELAHLFLDFRRALPG